MDVIRVDVDSRVLLHEQKEELFLELQRAVDAIYGKTARIVLEPDVSRWQQRWVAETPRPTRHFKEFGRKVGNNLDG
jgi:hypothetical protein